jgi:WD40 repeat protein
LVSIRTVNGVPLLVTIAAGFAAAAEPPSTPPVRSNSLPAGAVLRLGTNAFKVPGVCGVAFRANGDLVALDRELTLHTWPSNRVTAPALLPIPHKPKPKHMAISADARFAAAVWDNAVTVWDVAGARPSEVLTRPAKNAHIVLFSPDATWLAVGDGRRQWETVLLCHLPTRVWHEIPLPAAGDHSLSFSADGKRLAAMNRDTVAVMDTADGRDVMRRAVNDLSPAAVALSASGDTLAVLSAPLLGRAPKPVVLFAVASGEPAADLKPAAVRSHWVSFGPDRKTLLLGGEDGVHVWDAIKGEDVRTLPGPRSSAPVFAPDGRRWAAHSEGAVFVWDLATGRPAYPEQFEAGHTDQILGVAVSPDSRLIATDSGDNEFIVWAADTGRLLWRVWSPGPGVFTPDSRSVITVGEDWATPVLRDAATGRVVRRFVLPPDRANQEFVQSMRPSGDGKTLATDACPFTQPGPATYRVRWDVATGKELDRVEIKSELMVRVLGTHRPVYSPDGEWFPGWGGLFRTATGELHPLPWPAGTGQGWGLSRFAADSRLVASMCVGQKGDGNWDLSRTAVVVYDLGTRTAIEVPTRLPFGMALSPDGRTLAVLGEDDVSLWDVATGKLRRRFEVTNGRAVRREGVAFTPDGRRLLSCSGDSTVLIWDVTGLTSAAVPPAATASDLDAWWSALAADDPWAGHQAVWALIGRPAQAVPLLRERMKPAAISAEKLTSLIQQADAPRFADRAAADGELRRLGDIASPALRAALLAGPSPEQRQRIEALLKVCEDPTAGEPLRTIRAVAVLERAGTADSQRLLKNLASGPSGFRATREAAAALARLADRSARKDR